ncbi:MAG TPA: glutamate racemase [Chloroflexota bacterium]|nr:glutamate racemase [Chloroflexota bacterium]
MKNKEHSPACEVAVDQRAIGVFDSGIGGLSVFREIRRLLPGEDLVYFADQANCPYGPRSTEEIRGLALVATARLLNHNVKLVVVACNTASTAALAQLRESFPGPFVGIVPAIKPACSLTRTGRIAVLATEATLKSAAFELLVERHGQGARILRQPCPEFVDLVETGRADAEETADAVRARLAGLREAGIDFLVLGCTHFEFLRPTIERFAGPTIQVIGAAKPVAEQTARVLSQNGLLAERERGALRLETSGESKGFEELAYRLLGNAGRLEANHHLVDWAASQSPLPLGEG